MESDKKFKGKNKERKLSLRIFGRMPLSLGHLGYEIAFWSRIKLGTKRAISKDS